MSKKKHQTYDTNPKVLWLSNKQNSYITMKLVFVLEKETFNAFPWSFKLPVKVSREKINFKTNYYFFFVYNFFLILWTIDKTFINLLS